MSINPFKLRDEVDGNFSVEKLTTYILYFDNGTNNTILYNKEKLSWNSDGYTECLSLNEIFKQIVKKENLKESIPLIKVIYESGLWGAIFETGNYKELGKQWFVHGITKGYA